MQPESGSKGLRELALALLLGGVGSLGALPLGGRTPELFAALAWIAIAAAPLGALACALGVRLAPYGLVAPAIWMAAIAWLDAAVARDLATPLWGALAWSGLYAFGWALARFATERRAWVAPALACATLALSALPEKAHLAREPWPAEVTAWTLDASPLAWVTESAGAIDWPWQKSHYAALGIDRFERRAFRGRLAGPVLLVVGCALAWLAAALRRPRPSAPRPAE
jgi:hypothetical protein